MIVTAVERTARRGRVAVHIDDEPAFEIAREIARGRDLRPGRAIDRDEIDALVAEDASKQALNIAVAMLARRPHSEREVLRRLARRKCAPELAGETVRKLRAARLLDDAEYARAWTESRDRSSPRGRRLIVQELRASGVALEIAQEAATAVSDADAAYRAALRRMRGLSALEYEAFRNKLGGMLQRRGFGWETCRATVERCWREWRDAQTVSDAEL